MVISSASSSEFPSSQLPSPPNFIFHALTMPLSYVSYKVYAFFFFSLMSSSSRSSSSSPRSSSSSSSSTLSYFSSSRYLLLLLLQLPFQSSKTVADNIQFDRSMSYPQMIRVSVLDSNWGRKGVESHDILKKRGRGGGSCTCQSYPLCHHHLFSSLLISSLPSSLVPILSSSHSVLSAHLFFLPLSSFHCLQPPHLSILILVTCLLQRTAGRGGLGAL